MAMIDVKAREILGNMEELAIKFFDGLIDRNKKYDYQYIDSRLQNVIVIGDFLYQVPALKELYKDAELASFFDHLSRDASHFFKVQWEINKIIYYRYYNHQVEEQSPSQSLMLSMFERIVNYRKWAGYLDQEGNHIINLRNPVPGVHFSTNLLLGNRMGYPYPLQTTPKSVVDRFGGGSFRAHAATQVLATRWDMLPEENGFPANRQFYLLENGKQIFYSADVMDSNIMTAICEHAKNYTLIEYITKCGLHISRKIFLLPQFKGLPIATEVQRITIKNKGVVERNIKIVMTGMIGSAAPAALMEDVVYSTVIMESGLLQNEQGDLLAYIPHYYPEYCRKDIRFMSAMFYEKDEKKLASELCTNYGEFIGNGNLYKPEGVGRLTNRLSTKGPGFLALGEELVVGPQEEVTADQYAGLISILQDDGVASDVIHREINELHNRFNTREKVEEAFLCQQRWYRNYKSYLQIGTKNNQMNAYINHNLPFQVLYQTFVSRSFDLTQKGYREIGFREIQDIYASMYYFLAMGEEAFVKSLLKEWVEKVFEFGYCYHNFFWKGKEPGKWSDDGLWLVPAVYRYIQYTGDISILDEQYEIAEGNGRKRSLYDTLKAIIHYSSVVSVGTHGLPLIDFADWNDCLKLDQNYLSGPDKENRTEPFEGYSESVMNGFLLKLAMDHMKEFAKDKDDNIYLDDINIKIANLSDNLRRHGWKEDFYARVLFSRYGTEITYLGAGKDGFSRDEKIDGTYFLNSFSWSILSNEATEEQIAFMLKVVEENLKTAYGFSLMSPTDLSKIAKSTATAEYFPGDRENGGIFKHATMMATVAMLRASKTVQNITLATRLRDMAYWMMDLVLPYKTLDNPFISCGNPRWCTQYINSQTGEHIGPTLSGTSTWLSLTIFEALGIEYKRGKLILDPMLARSDKITQFKLRYRDTYYNFLIRKPNGFYRVKDGIYNIMVDGKEISHNEIVLVNDQKDHHIEMTFNQ